MQAARSELLGPVGSQNLCLASHLAPRVTPKFRFGTPVLHQESTLPDLPFSLCPPQSRCLSIHESLLFSSDWIFLKTAPPKMRISRIQSYALRVRRASETVAQALHRAHGCFRKMESERAVREERNTRPIAAPSLNMIPSNAPVRG